ncbi:hypothetical protein K493DRAFT_307433 [Basidiobolus meristosporus CBS 931.73]|uniref:Arrestin C-terminal-like domain-containing protein n=1 Tax=Basidiobolus meristosporus CBS 931.73 TaxID=1314790 RepID=A0A1Y1XGI3_9FUNG|nr:hypothetical protein K493DRAFT_307433 [Basidiobolus meristosporus CBS 931.73]|eukprot:ORX84516.1 hypothetical protein K493DRAFT_307433 [Basidiobolus meristosporus CBS 931.73]
MWANNNLHVHLFSDEVVFRGCQDSATGQALRGYVQLDLRSASKIHSLQLYLQGVVMIPFERPEIFVQHRIEFLESTQQTKGFSCGTYVYHFELPLAGDLPESVQSRDGAIKYLIKAVAKREGFSLQSEMKHERLVRIRRIHSTAVDDINSQELLKFGEVRGEIGFTIYSDSNSYQPGQQVLLNIGTRLLNDKSKIESLRICIIEAVRYCTKNGSIKSIKRPLPNTLHYVDLRKHNPPVHSNRVQMPIDQNAQPDCKSPFLKLTHLIEIQISILSSSGTKKYVVVRTPLQICDKEDEFLPSYQPGCQELPPRYEIQYTSSH